MKHTRTITFVGAVYSALLEEIQRRQYNNFKSVTFTQVINEVLAGALGVSIENVKFNKRIRPPEICPDSDEERLIAQLRLEMFNKKKVD